jgi:hypothetical protein
MACETRPKGPGESPEKELVKVRRKVGRLEQELARYQALARITQRAVGVRPPASPGKVKGGKRRKCGKPTVRALKAADGFKRGMETTEAAAPMAVPVVK